ncbi:hypothetical protein A3C86_02360 [Candidatus Kaiserbacteria bacterium RIFCSPHIGHO2_02_FULL_49_16]|uniref:Uncharacterized protein n=1 Tax=Candidatus Kaiserbacteria bacterium RIFCSPHIGHO2_02_FULL_49_16 TaxID=1798490 RepID=A0A1F6DCU9_9BACT|nr:MAG: hypothetical protein A3C86_02360 [Candidatus Kaiserbacteria bacterium RIFCSPHIGHO2_02_FULL_49_16]
MSANIIEKMKEMTMAAKKKTHGVAPPHVVQVSASQLWDIKEYAAMGSREAQEFVDSLITACPKRTRTVSKKQSRA